MKTSEKALSKPSLVIVTTHFGTNFSGGSTATCEIFSRIENEFSEIIVVGNELGKHPFNSIHFLNYKNWMHALLILNRLKVKNAIFYGDFYNSFFFILLNIPYYFTYHDNWPEQSKLSFKSKFHSLFYTFIYKSIFKKAKLNFTVSEFKYRYIRRYSERVQLVYNGFNRQHVVEKDNKVLKKKSVLMVGNIDRRKYKLALEVFQYLETSKQEVSIDIYGHIRDNKLAKKLMKFTFVNLKGYVKTIPFSKYNLLLHTSLIESFGMIFCEAIFQNIPILTFEVGGAKELVNSSNGILIKPYDTKKMEIELGEMLNGNSKFTFSEDQLSVFSWNKASEQYKNYLNLC